MGLLLVKPFSILMINIEQKKKKIFHINMYTDADTECVLLSGMTEVGCIFGFVLVMEIWSSLNARLTLYHAHLTIASFLKLKRGCNECKSNACSVRDKEALAVCT